MDIFGLITVVLMSQSMDLGDAVRLPQPDLKGGMPLAESIAARRSIRGFTSQPLTVAQIGQLLWAAQGITEKRWGLRASPSAGALYPLETYVVLPAGVYHYSPHDHELKRIREGDRRQELQGAALGQGAVGNAPAVFVFSAVYKRTAAKYGGRADRYVDMEAGHACQNLLLQAVALSLGAVPVGAFHDKRVAGVLDLPKNEKPLYLVPVGHPGKG